MTLRRTLPVWLSVLFAAAGAAPQPAPGFADAILGRWDVTVEGADGPYPSWLEVMLRKETELMGRFVGRFGSNRHVSHITYTSGELVVRIPVQYEQNTSDLVFKGRLAGDRLEGTTEAADGRVLEWTGVRAPALERTAQPAWDRPIDLFNGKDLTGWKLRDGARGACWTVVDGAMTNAPPCVDIVSERTFGDFKLHVEFNMVPKSNSGIYLRGRYEAQIQDDLTKATDSLRMGGIYGFLRPSVNASGRAGEWQSYDITLVGRRVTAVLNGRTVVDDAEIPGITGGALDSHEAAPGPLVLQGDHGQVSFRKVIVTPAAGPVQETNPRFGRWKLKSDAPPPASNIMTYEPFGKRGMKVTIDAVSRDGVKTQWWYTTNFDGEDSPVAGNPGQDASAVTVINDRINQIVNKKGGRVTTVLINVLSPDGGTIANTYIRVGPDGKTAGVSYATYERMP